MEEDYSGKPSHAKDGSEIIQNAMGRFDHIFLAYLYGRNENV